MRISLNLSLIIQKILALCVANITAHNSTQIIKSITINTADIFRIEGTNA